MFGEFSWAHVCQRLETQKLYKERIISKAGRSKAVRQTECEQRCWWSCWRGSTVCWSLSSHVLSISCWQVVYDVGQGGIIPLFSVIIFSSTMWAMFPLCWQNQCFTPEGLQHWCEISPAWIVSQHWSKSDDRMGPHSREVWPVGQWWLWSDCLPCTQICLWSRLEVSYKSVCFPSK